MVALSVLSLVSFRLGSESGESNELLIIDYENIRVKKKRSDPEGIKLAIELTDYMFSNKERNKKMAAHTLLPPRDYW